MSKTLHGTKANDPASLRIAADFLEENGFEEEAQALVARADYIDRDKITDEDERYRLYLEMTTFVPYGEKKAKEEA